MRKTKLFLLYREYTRNINIFMGSISSFWYDRKIIFQSKYYTLDLSVFVLSSFCCSWEEAAATFLQQPKTWFALDLLFSFFTLTTSCGGKRCEIKRPVRKQGLTSGWPFRRRNLLMWDKMLSERRWSHLFSARRVIQPARGISISSAVADRLVMVSGVMLYMANMHVFICLLFTTID